MTSPWWLTWQAREHPGTGHDPDLCDHRYFANELRGGWMWWTPAQRFETVDDVKPVDGGHWIRVWTDKTGPDWSWRLDDGARVHAIPPAGELGWPGAHLRFIDLHRSRNSAATMHIVPANTAQTIPDFTLALVRADHLGDGQGWRVVDRPDGGDQVITEHTTKAGARTALLTAGRRHADLLGLPLIKESDLES